MLKGKTALVTGSTSGIGLGIAKALAAQGANIVLNGFGDVEGPKAEVAALGVQVAYHGADMTKPAEIEDMVAFAQQTFGSLDVLVNNAGWDVFKPFTKTVPAEWDKLIAINLTGALHMHHAVLPGMAARGAGRIVNIASDAARGGSSGEAVYAACKGGLVALSARRLGARTRAPQHHGQRGLPRPHGHGVAGWFCRRCPRSGQADGGIPQRDSVGTLGATRRLGGRHCVLQR